MKTLTPGHKYGLDNFEDSTRGQTIQFIEKEARPPEGLVTVNDGTTNEEVLVMLIDRLNFLKKKLPSRETSQAITKLDEALLWLNKRTAERKARGVGGTTAA